MFNNLSPKGVAGAGTSCSSGLNDQFYCKRIIFQKNAMCVIMRARGCHVSAKVSQAGQYHETSQFSNEIANFCCRNENNGQFLVYKFVLREKSLKNPSVL